MLGELNAAIKITAAQEPALLSALGNGASVSTLFRAGIKPLRNFIHDNAASVTSTLFNKRAAFEVGQCVFFFIAYKIKHTRLLSCYIIIYTLPKLETLETGSTAVYNLNCLFLN